jgi:hypothetical protein
MRSLFRKSLAFGAISVFFAGLTPPGMAAGNTGLPQRKCPFEKRTVGQVVSAIRGTELTIAQAPTPAQPLAAMAPPEVVAPPVMAQLPTQLAQVTPVPGLEPTEPPTTPAPGGTPTEPPTTPPASGTPAEPAPGDTPPATDPAVTEAVERVRAVYKTICSRSRQAELPPSEQPLAPAAVPMAAPEPVRALW